MRTFKKYFRVWWMMSKNSFVSVLYSKLAIFIFLSGKLLRFGFFFAFIYFLVGGSRTLVGYSAHEVLFFFLTFNIIDVVSQFLFREVYRFRPKVVSGGFDLTLAHPINPLFISLMGGADVIDFITIPPLIVGTVYLATLLHPTLLGSIFYILLIINGLIIATAFYIAVMAIGIITLEVDNTIMIYRDLTALGKFPVEIYKQPLQGIITFLVPVGIMMSLPVKALIGLVTPVGVFASLGFGGILLFLSFKFWDFALTKYTSASS